MKKIIFALLAIGASLITACDFNEEPKSSASVDMVFSSEGGLQTYAYSFYNVLPDYSDAAHRNATLDYGPKQSISGMEVGAYTVNSSTSWSWTALRNINFFLENNVDERVPAAVRDNYNGIARLFRARFYFDKLVQYGPVPWIDKVFNSPEDPDLYNPRDSRDLIISKIIEDLDFAYNNITVSGVTSNSSTVNKWIAMGFKSRVCLFEAAWRKYHANDQLDIARTGCTQYTPDALYNLAAQAAKEVIDKGPYKLHGGTAYKGGGTGAYRELFTSIDTQTDEVMLAIVCDAAIQLGENNWWWNSSTYGPHLGMSRKFAKTYLNIDGTPYTEFNADGSFKQFFEETNGRDPRMNMTLRAYDYIRKTPAGDALTPANFQGHALSGYQVTKFVMDDISYDDARTNDNNTPLMRFGEILLNYAEAKAELGTLSDAEWAQTVGALRKRAGITGGTAATGTLTTKPTEADPYMAAYYPPMANNPVMLEVMREREIELAYEGFRLIDLKRWGLCNLWVEDPWEGIFIPAINAPVDLNGDGKPDSYFYDTDAIGDATYAPIGVYVGTKKNNYLNVKPVEGGYFIFYAMPGRDWPQRQYLYPIPQVVLDLNSDKNQLTQNPGW